MKIDIISEREAQLIQGTDGSAGYDLVVTTGTLIGKNEVIKFKTGLRMNIADKGVVAIIVPRSSLGVKKGLRLANGTGVIDSDYQGEVQVFLQNMSNDVVSIVAGDRVAQVLFIPVIHPELNFVDAFSEETARGSNGFGSTGGYKS